MANEAAILRTVVSGKTRMTRSEAFLKMLVADGVTDMHRIVGSALGAALAADTPT